VCEGAYLDVEVVLGEEAEGGTELLLLAGEELHTWVFINVQWARGDSDCLLLPSYFVLQPRTDAIIHVSVAFLVAGGAVFGGVVGLGRVIKVRSTFALLAHLLLLFSLALLTLVGQGFRLRPDSQPTVLLQLLDALAEPLRFEDALLCVCVCVYVCVCVCR
jgi:hypothetical protein